MKGLRLTRRGEIVRDTLIVVGCTAATFPALTVVILFFRALGV